MNCGQNLMNSETSPKHISRHLVPTRDFEATVRFFQGVMEFPLEQRGVPKDDLQFQRYARFRMPNGIVMEVVEPTKACAFRYLHPVVSISVGDFAETLRRMETQGVTPFTDMTEPDKGYARTYFESPGGLPFQLNLDPTTPQHVSKNAPGVAWILIPTLAFDTDLAFFSEGLGLSLVQQGTPVDDRQFLRYAQFELDNRMVLELLEPSDECAETYLGPVLAIMTTDLLSMKSTIEAAGTAFLTDVIRSEDGWAWTYFNVPGAGIFQLYGVYGTK